MWFRLASAEWETGKHLGAMDILADAWSVGYNVSGGITKTSGSGSVSKGGTLTATFTLSEGATFTSATLTPVSAGTVTHSVSSSTVTVTIANVSANCTLAVVATGGSSSGGGGNGGNEGDTPTDLKTYELTWEAGGIDVSYGQDNNMEDRRRTVDYIPIEYAFAQVTTQANVHVIFFDTNKAYLAPTSSTVTTMITVKTDLWTNLLTYMPEGAAYFRIVARTGDEAQDSTWKPLRNTPVVVADVTNLVWEAGGLNVVTGVDNNADDIMTTRRRHLYYIPISYKTITINGGTVNAHAVYYNSSGEYLGTTMTDNNSTYGNFSVLDGGTYDITVQAPSGTAFYRLMSRTGDAAQDAYWSFSQ